MGAWRTSERCCSQERHLREAQQRPWKSAGQVVKSRQKIKETRSKRKLQGQVGTDCSTASWEPCAAASIDPPGREQGKLFIQKIKIKGREEEQETRRTRRERSTNDRHRSEKDRLEKLQNRHRRRCQGNKIEKTNTRRNAAEDGDQKIRGEGLRRNAAEKTQESRRFTMKTEKRGGVC